MLGAARMSTLQFTFFRSFSSSNMGKNVRKINLHTQLLRLQTEHKSGLSVFFVGNISIFFDKGRENGTDIILMNSTMFFPQCAKALITGWVRKDGFVASTTDQHTHTHTHVKARALVSDGGLEATNRKTGMVVLFTDGDSQWKPASTVLRSKSPPVGLALRRHEKLEFGWMDGSRMCMDGARKSCYLLYFFGG